MLSLSRSAERPLAYGPIIRQDLLMIEMSEAMLEEVCSSGVSIKGNPAGEAVLCTQAATFDLKAIETTNSILLVEAGDSSRQQTGQEPVLVRATAGSHVDVVLAAPRLADLEATLQARAIGREDDSMAVDGQEPAGVPFNDLLDLFQAAVQASEAELEAELQSIGAVDVGQGWQGIDPDHLATLLQMLILTAAQHGWPLQALPEQQVSQALEQDGYPARLVLFCLERFGRATNDTDSDQRMWSLCSDKVGRHTADALFRKQGRWEMTEFVQQWQEALPEGMQPDYSLLQGLALVEQLGEEQAVVLYPARGLSQDPATRFAQLFAMRPRWAAADLEAYLADLQAPGQSVQMLLLKYARANQASADAPVEYSSR